MKSNLANSLASAPNWVSAGISPALPTKHAVRTGRLKRGNKNAPTVL